MKSVEALSYDDTTLDPLAIGTYLIIPRTIANLRNRELPLFRETV